MWFQVGIDCIYRVEKNGARARASLRLPGTGERERRGNTEPLEGLFSRPDMAPKYCNIEILRRLSRLPVLCNSWCSQPCLARPCLSGFSVGTGRARLLGFRVGFASQNPSLGTLRLSDFGPFRALGFSGLFQAFLV